MVAGIGAVAAAMVGSAAANAGARSIMADGGRYSVSLSPEAAVGSMTITGNGGAVGGAVAGDVGAIMDGPDTVPAGHPAQLAHATLVGDDGQVIQWVRGKDHGPFPETYSGNLVVEGSPNCEECAARLRGQLWLARLAWSTGDVVMVWGGEDDRHGWEFWPNATRPADHASLKYGAGWYSDNRAAIHAAIMFGVSILNPTTTPDDPND